jgi:hypothetical protein
MTSQIITLSCTDKDCWVVNRIGSDAPQMMWQTIEDDWFDVMDAYGIIAYSEATYCPTVPYQLVLRGQLHVC